MIAVRPQYANYFIFMNYVKIPFRNMTDPRVFNLQNVHNFYLDVEPEVRVGIWHYIPKPLEYEFESDHAKTVAQHFEKYFKKSDNRPIFIYSHGNDRDRSDGDRIKICSNLANLGYHVFAIDYRGYGDSTGTPSEDGIVKDVLNLHNFIKSYQKQAKIFLWGHSLGTGISAHAGKVLTEFNSPPAGIVLEAPFINISQAAQEYIIAPLILNNPWIIKKSLEALDILNIKLDTAFNIVRIKSKILILHAEDDWFIPQDRSRDLVEICRKERPNDYPPVKLVELHEKHGLGHCKIGSHAEIYPIVKEFVEKD